MKKVPKKLAKAIELLRSGRVKFIGKIGSSLYFKVFSNKEHEVIFKLRDKKWLCDCEYFSIKGKECSHIKACKLWLLKFPDTLKLSMKESM